MWSILREIFLSDPLLFYVGLLPCAVFKSIHVACKVAKVLFVIKNFVNHKEKTDLKKKKFNIYSIFTILKHEEKKPRTYSSRCLLKFDLSIEICKLL